MKWYELRSTNLLIGLILSLAFTHLFVGFTTVSTQISIDPVDSLSEMIYISNMERTVQKKIPKESVETKRSKSPIKDFIEVPDLDTINWVDTSILIIDTVRRGTSTAKVFSDTIFKPGGRLPDIASDVDDIPLVRAQQMPYYGKCKNQKNKTADEKYECSQNELIRFFSEKSKYPKRALENGIEGKVFLRFIVGKTGAVENIQILREPGGGLGEEALRVAKKLGDFTPARQNGRPVKVIMTIPVVFKLD